MGGHADQRCAVLTVAGADAVAVAHNVHEAATRRDAVVRVLPRIG